MKSLTCDGERQIVIRSGTRAEVGKGKFPSVTPVCMDGHSSLAVESNHLTLVRCWILLEVFDGVPERWESYLEDQATEEQRQHDLPFVKWLCQAMRTDPRLEHAIRRIVH